MRMVHVHVVVLALALVASMFVVPWIANGMQQDLAPDTPAEAEQWAETQLAAEAESVTIYENGTATATWANGTTTTYRLVSMNATAEVVG